jgi:hypothetical protein
VLVCWYVKSASKLEPAATIMPATVTIRFSIDKRLL